MFLRVSIVSGLIFWGASASFAFAATIGPGPGTTNIGGATISGTGERGILAFGGIVVNGRGQNRISLTNPGGPGPIGLVTLGDGTTILWRDSTIVTRGSESGGALVQPGGLIAITRASVVTDGFGLKASGGILTATNASIHAGGPGVVMVAGVPSAVTISGGLMSSGGDSFAVGRTTANIRVEKGASILPGDGANLLTVAPGGIVAFDADRVNLQGDIEASRTSRVTVNLANGSNFSGRVQRSVLVMDGSSQWRMTRSSSLVSLNVAPGGLVAFASPSGSGFRRLTINRSLTGSGTFGLNVNLGRNRGDQIVLKGTSSGGHTLVVTNRGTAPTQAGQALKVVDAGSRGGADFRLAGEKVEAGALEYRLVRGDEDFQNAPDPEDWYLANISNGGGTTPLSSAGKAIVNTAGAQALTWLGELESLGQRMGELRLGLYTPPEPASANKATGDAKETIEAKDQSTAANPRGDVWVRGYGRRMNADTGLTGGAFGQYVYGVDLGVDKAFRLDRSWLVVGASGGWGGASRWFDNGGDGLTESIHGSLYATWFTDNGWYLDGVGKLNYFDNRFDAVSAFGEHSRGHYGNWGFGFSLEGGKRIELGRGWYLEPQAQAAYTHLSASNYTTSDDIPVQLTGADAFQMRAGMSAGKRFATALGVLQPFATVSYLQTLSCGGNLSAGGYSERPNLDGAGVEAGAGVIMEVSERAQIYGEYQFVAAERYVQPWSVSGGFRWLW